jgi:prevent-host-death family protein
MSRPIDERGQSWLDVAMKRVGVAELKNNLSRELRAVEAGEEVEVMDRARPIARIVPVAGPAVGRGREVRIQPARRPFDEIRDRRYEPLPGTSDSLALLIEERGER